MRRTPQHAPSSLANAKACCYAKRLASARPLIQVAALTCLNGKTTCTGCTEDRQGTYRIASLHTSTEGTAETPNDGNPIPPRCLIIKHMVAARCVQQSKKIEMGGSDKITGT